MELLVEEESTNPALYQILKQYDQANDRILLKEIQLGTTFLFNKKEFIKLEKKRSRSICQEVHTKKKYSIAEIAEVETPKKKA